MASIGYGTALSKGWIVVAGYLAAFLVALAVFASPAHAAITIAPANVPDAVVGTAYSTQLTASGGTAPYTFAITAGTVPGLSLQSDGTLSGTPTAEGIFLFTVTAFDSAAASASRTIRITVLGAVSISIEPPTLPDGEVGEPYSRQLTASGGTAPYVFDVIDGALPDGLSLSTAGAVAGTPTVAGAFDFRVSATDVNGFKGERSYTIAVSTVAEAADPIWTEVYRQAVRFARTQTGHVVDRLEAVRAGGCDTFDWRLIAASRAGTDGDVTATQAGPDPASAEPDLCSDEPLRAWSAGVVQIGERGRAGGGPAIDFVTAGVTAGIDYRFSAGALAGVAVGLGRDAADIGADGSSSDAMNLSLALYGSVSPTEDIYIDAVGGVGLLGYDTRRFVPSADAFATDERTGTQLFGALGAGWRSITQDGWSVELGARLEGTLTSLERSTETGAGAANATYFAETVPGLDGVVAFTVRRPIETRWGPFVTRAALEYRHAFENGFEQTYSLAGNPGQRLRIEGDLGPQDSVSLALGGDLLVGEGLSLGLDLTGAAGSGGFLSGGVQGRLSLRF